MFDDDLPSAIVPALRAFAHALSQHSRSHRDVALGQHEQGLLAVWRAHAPAFLEGTLRATTTGLDPQVRPLRERCPRCGTARAFLDSRSRTLKTCLGPIAYERPWYHCRPCHAGWSPPDQTLGVAAYERTSGGVRTWAAALGAAHTFAEAQALVATLAGVHMGEETVRTHAEAIGATLEQRQQVASAHVQAEQEPEAAGAQPAPGQLVVETDGVMVRYRDTGCHEVKLGLVAGCYTGNGRPPSDPAYRPPVLVQPSYVAAREPPERFGPRLLAEAARRGALDPSAGSSRPVPTRAWPGSAGRRWPCCVRCRSSATERSGSGIWPPSTSASGSKWSTGTTPASICGRWPRPCLATARRRPPPGPSRPSTACGATAHRPCWPG